MSLATRCTHCGTIFKVVQDQLKVSEGWVRCGRCHEVFNALPALFDLDTEAPPPRQVPPPSSPAPSPSPSAFAQPTQPTPQPAPPAFAQPPAAPAMAPPPSWTRTQPAGLNTGPASVSSPMPAPMPAPAAAPPAPPTFAPPPASISTHTPLTSADLAFGAKVRTPASGPVATTDFELDTSVDLSDPTPLAHDGRLQLSEEPRPWLDEPPQDVPSTDEADALESRYLLPSDTRQVRRRERGPEFADAEFPSDVDADNEWTHYQDSVPAPLNESPPISTLSAPSPSPLALATSSDVGSPAQATPNGASSAESAADSSLLRRPDEGYVPEQAVQPPSQRRGRSGTRGRDPASQPPEFVRRAQRQAFWRLPAVQAAMGLFAVLLALSLTLQLGHHFRDWIAAHHPGTRPLLKTWCAQVGCEIKPPMRLDALQVDSATLVRTASEGPNRYRLTVSVNNRSDVELAWPHVDLTLTDDRGSVIARRAFAPRDAQVAKGEGMPLLSVPDAAPASESTQLQWLLKLDDLAPAGYTAELFYP